jgi:hypothetical protein
MTYYTPLNTLGKHPGGSRVISHYAGQDATVSIIYAIRYDLSVDYGPLTTTGSFCDFEMGDIILCNNADHNCYQLQFCICGRETHTFFVLIVILFNQKHGHHRRFLFLIGSFLKTSPL